MIRERDLGIRRAALAFGERFSNVALGTAGKFVADFNIQESLRLTHEQTKLFTVYFAHYWVLKSHIDIARMARNPILEQMLKFPILSGISKNIYAQNDGINDSGETFLEMAQKYTTEIQNGNQFEIRNAANILSSIILEGSRGDELNQKIDRALSRIRIGKSAASQPGMI